VPREVLTALVAEIRREEQRVRADEREYPESAYRVDAWQIEEWADKLTELAAAPQPPASGEPVAWRWKGAYGYTLTGIEGVAKGQAAAAGVVLAGLIWGVRVG